jgi:hypothetical protein
LGVDVTWKTIVDTPESPSAFGFGLSIEIEYGPPAGTGAAPAIARPRKTAPNTASVTISANGSRPYTRDGVRRDALVLHRCCILPMPLPAVLQNRGTLASRLPAIKEQGIANRASQAMSRVDY